MGHQVGDVAFPQVVRIAMDSGPTTADERLRQLHEIDPDRYHAACGATPDNCPHCADPDLPAAPQPEGANP